MSRQFRYRMAAIALGGLIFGAPMLTNGWASAERLPEGARQVTFAGGGVFGISCRSRPDVESMTVPAETVVRVVNNTGHDAKLQLGGETKGTLGDDQATEVVFRRGTTAVVLKPSCAIGDDVQPAMVTAAPSASAAMPDPTPAPTGGMSASTMIAPSDSSRPATSSAGSALPDSADRSSRATSAAGATTRRPASLRTSGTARLPHGGAAAQTKVNTPGRTPLSTAPEFAGMPPGDRKALVPGVPSVELSAPMTDAAPAAAAPPPTEVAAAEPVATMQPIPAGQPIGLLALIAAVCLVGVSIAAIRAIVSQRANRASMA